MSFFFKVELSSSCAAIRCLIAPFCDFVRFPPLTSNLFSYKNACPFGAFLTKGAQEDKKISQQNILSKKRFLSFSLIPGINNRAMFSKSTIKYIQSLQHKKFRDEYNVFVAEGPKLVTELLLSNDFSVKAVFALQSWVDGLDAAIVASMQPCLTIIKDFELEKIAHYTTANKVVAVFGKKKEDVNFSVKNKITLLLDDIQDPGNLGTIIRTADW